MSEEKEIKQTAINWYPGHMTRTIRQMKEDIKLIDLVIEILDARIPEASRNPDIDDLAKQKYRLIVLNKADLADPSWNDRWTEHYRNRNTECVTLDSRKNTFAKDMTKKILSVCHEKIERDRRRGILNRPVRVMICGIPNTGKSTFINSFAGSAVTKTGNKAGVTRGKQWIKINRQIELLDTPGVLWPKIDDPGHGLHIAAMGSMNDQILDIYEICTALYRELAVSYGGLLSSYLGCEDLPDESQLFSCIASAKNLVKAGGVPDEERAALLFLDDLRRGKIGRVTLERC